MEIAPDIHMIPGAVGSRPLQLYMLIGDDRVALLDTGCAPDPDRLIFPYLTGIGLTPADVDMVIVTHSDLDHCGGNAAMKRANPNVLITCGEADRALVEDPAVMWARRYNRYAGPHDLAYSENDRKWIMDMLGDAQPVDVTWRGGETLRLGRDWRVEIHHVPGHSDGHLAVFDPRSRTVLTGDAVHGSVYLDLDGNPALCPTYLNVDTYLVTINYLRGLGAEILGGCHWPIKRGAAVGAFLDESRQFVEQADLALLAELDRRPGGATLQELIAAVGPRLGGWPRSVDHELKYALAGNLDRLAALGKVTADAAQRPIRYQLA
ncbi:MAG TPA: MBL fold metallo-hydrolase [Anaerolineae bacterium]|nr:MBL fold metallo-hydrolase [Anaerolineae bacterium]